MIFLYPLNIVYIDSFLWYVIAIFTQLAIVAKHHGVPFYVCSPTTSIDQTLRAGADIPIEERSHKEMTDVAGTRIAAPGECYRQECGVWKY